MTISDRVFGQIPGGHDVRLLSIGSAPGPVVEVLTLGATDHADVGGTSFDFREPVAIGRAIRTEHPQVVDVHGIDHNYVVPEISSTAPAARPAAVATARATGSPSSRSSCPTRRTVRSGRRQSSSPARSIGRCSSGGSPKLIDVKSTPFRPLRGRDPLRVFDQGVGQDAAVTEPVSREQPPARPVPWRERSQLARWRRLWRTRRPRTFTEKVRYKMLRDHRELMVTFSDKVAVRDHVASIAGAHVLPDLLHVLDDPGGLEGLALPASFVLKPSHGSGVAVIVSPRAEPGSRLPEPRYGWTYAHVRAEDAPVEHLVELGRAWLSQLYGQGPNREWAYGRVPRRLMVEELLTGADGTVPDDYKLFVFHGTCRYVQVDRGRFERRTQDFFTPEWKHLPLSGGHPWAEPARPERLAEMVELAERLGASTDFVRVDLYDLPGRLVFGELSSFPAGGDSPFEPESYNLEFARHWTPPRRYR